MNAISSGLVLFLLMLTGFICAKIKITGPEIANYFSRFVICISLPALLLTSFQQPFSRELLRETGLVFFISTLIFAVSFFVALIYPRIMKMKGPERGVHRYAIIIPNSGFIGYPMVEAILGPAFLFHAAIYNITFTSMSLSLCAWLIAKEGKQSLKISWKTFVNQIVIATLVGFLFFIFAIRLPGPLYRSLKMLGDATSPLSMIVIGTTLAQANIRQVFGRPGIYVTVIIRLLALPVLAGVVSYILGIRGPLLAMTVLLTAMPAGSSTSLLASLYQTAAEEASSLVFLSTVLNMVTVPLIMLFMEFYAK